MKRSDTGRKAGGRVKTIRVVIVATLWAFRALYNAFYNSSPLSQPHFKRADAKTFLKTQQVTSKRTTHTWDGISQN